jgi:hypothetical protein
MPGKRLEFQHSGRGFQQALGEKSSLVRVWRCLFKVYSNTKACPGIIALAGLGMLLSEICTGDVTVEATTCYRAHLLLPSAVQGYKAHQRLALEQLLVSYLGFLRRKGGLWPAAWKHLNLFVRP